MEEDRRVIVLPLIPGVTAGISTPTCTLTATGPGGTVTCSDDVLVQ